MELCSVLSVADDTLFTCIRTCSQGCGKPTVEDLASHRLLASLTLLEPLDTLFVFDR